MRKAIAFVIAILLSLTSCGIVVIEPVNRVNKPTDTELSANVDVTDKTEYMAETTTAAETLPAVMVEPARVSFIGCGDNIIYYGNVREAAGKGSGDREYGFAYSYENVAHLIGDADISFINQETLMCGDGFDISYYPTFNSPREVGLDLVDLGFDVVNIANNHMLDKTGSGLEKTVEFWKNQPVLMIGGYESVDDYNTARYLEYDGMKIAFLSYTYGTNGFVVSDSHNVYIPYLNEEDIIRQTGAAKADSDFVIVSVHWGEEGAFTPSEDQRKYAKLFADCGVDVIVGHHPHVIQPVEWIEGENGGKTLCVYSLGNFMAEQADDFNMVGGMIAFDMVRRENGTTIVENVEFIPTVFHFNSSFYQNRVWLMEDYTAEMAASHGISYYGNYTSLEKLREYVTRTVDAQFLPDFLK